MTITDGAKLHTPTLGLYLKLTAVMVPTFLLFAAGGLLWMSEKNLLRSEEAMAMRIGNATARVGGALRVGRPCADRRSRCIAGSRAPAGRDRHRGAGRFDLGLIAAAASARSFIRNADQTHGNAALAHRAWRDASRRLRAMAGAAKPDPDRPRRLGASQAHRNLCGSGFAATVVVFVTQTTCAPTRVRRHPAGAISGTPA